MDLQISTLCNFADDYCGHHFCANLTSHRIDICVGSSGQKMEAQVPLKHWCLSVILHWITSLRSWEP